MSNMADIVNKVLKILMFSIIYQSCSTDSRDLQANHLIKRHEQPESGKLALQKVSDTDAQDYNRKEYEDSEDARPNDLERDIYDDDYIYDRLTPWKAARSDNPESKTESTSQDPFLTIDDVSSRLKNDAKEGDRQDRQSKLKGGARQERQPRLVESGLTAENGPIPGNSPDASFTADQGPSNSLGAGFTADQGQSAFSDARQLDAQGPGIYPDASVTGVARNDMAHSEATRETLQSAVVTASWNQAANIQQSPRIQYASRNDSSGGSVVPGHGWQQNPMKMNSAQSSLDDQKMINLPESPTSVNNANDQNVYTRPLKNGIISRNNANQPGSQPSQYKPEDLLSQQEEEMKTIYRQQTAQQNSARPSSTGDPCLLNPCLNSGICHTEPAPRGFECICDGGFQGRDCETKILPCDISGCSTLGFCVAAKTQSICMCKTQYTVKFCSMKLPSTVIETVESKIARPSSTGDPCLLNPCLNSGICHTDPAPRGYECICDGGFQGRDCETKIFPCDISGCSTLGFCVAAKTQGICMCKTQYPVKFCSMKLPSTVIETVESKIDPFLTIDDVSSRLKHDAKEGDRQDRQSRLKGGARQERQPRLVESGLTAENGPIPGNSPDASFTADQGPSNSLGAGFTADQGQSAFSDARQLDAQGPGIYPDASVTGVARNDMAHSEATRETLQSAVVTASWNQAANIQQSPRIQYASRSDSSGGSVVPGHGWQQNPMKMNSAQSSLDDQKMINLPESPTSVNNANDQNVYTRPLKNGIIPRNNANQPGSQPSPYKPEDLLSQQEEEMKTMYRQQTAQQNSARPSSTGDPCLLNPCLNSGICHTDPAPRGFECICDGGFQGRDCETKILPCDISGCSTLGFCLAAKTQGICMCKTQYTVKFCSMKLPSTVIETVESKIEEEVKELTSGDKKYKVIAAAGIFVVLCLLVHLYRVAKRQKKLKDDYKKKIVLDGTPPPPPPSLFKISNMLCREFFFCCGNPEDDTTKVKVTGSTSRSGRLKKTPSHTGYQVFPDEKLPSRSRLSSRANPSSKSHLSKTHMNGIPISTSVSSRAKLGDYASYSKGRLSQSHLADDGFRSKTRLSKTHLVDNPNSSTHRLSKTRIDDNIPSSKHSLSKQRLDEDHHNVADDISHSRSRVSRSQLADDISFNAQCSGRRRSSRKTGRQRERSSRGERRKLQPRSSHNKGMLPSQPRRQVKEKVYSEESLSDHNSDYMSSATSSEESTHQHSHTHPFHMKRKKPTFSGGLDSEHDSLNQANQTDSVYPNVSPRYSLPFMTHSFPNTRGRGYLEQPHHPYSRLQQNSRRERYCPTSGSQRRLDDNNGRFEGYIDNYASYINTNNNMTGYADNGNNSNIAECCSGLRNDANEDCPTASQNNSEHDDIGLVHTSNSNSSENREPLQHFETNNYKFKDDELYERPSSNDVTTNENRTCDFRHFDDFSSQYVDDSQHLIRCLTEPYTDKLQTNEFNDYNSAQKASISYNYHSVLNTDSSKDFNVENDKVKNGSTDENSFDEKLITPENEWPKEETSVITINSTDSETEINVVELTEEKNKVQISLVTVDSLKSENASDIEEITIESNDKQCSEIKNETDKFSQNRNASDKVDIKSL